MSVKKLCVLGATGSIGLNTLDVAARHPDKYEIYALSAHSGWQSLLDLCVQYSPKYAVISDERAADEARAAFVSSKVCTQLIVGPQGLIDIASLDEVDIVMAAIVGSAGLEASYAAADTGKKVLLRVGHYWAIGVATYCNDGGGRK